MSNDAIDYTVLIECGGGRGTGFPVAPGLIMTAGHVVAVVCEVEQRGQVFGEISLCWWYSNREDHGHILQANEVTQSYKPHRVADYQAGDRGVVWLDKDLDVALIACSDSLLPADIAPVRLNEAIPNSGSQFTCVGFPRIANRDGQKPRGIAVAGSINPLHEKRFEADITSPQALVRSPSEQHAGYVQKPFAGISGAAVQHEGRVIGLIRSNIRYGESHRLVTSSIAQILEAIKRDYNAGKIADEIYLKLFPEQDDSKRLLSDLRQLYTGFGSRERRQLAKHLVNEDADLDASEFAGSIIDIDPQNLAERLRSLYAETPANGPLVDAGKRIANVIFPARIFAEEIREIRERRVFSDHNFLDPGIYLEASAELIAAGLEGRPIELKHTTDNRLVGTACCEWPPEHGMQFEEQANSLIGDMGAMEGEDIAFCISKSANKRLVNSYIERDGDKTYRDRFCQAVDRRMKTDQRAPGHRQPYLLIDKSSASEDRLSQWQDQATRINWMDFYVVDPEKEFDDDDRLQPIYVSMIYEKSTS
ncbi:S1 family peptidase [Roseibium sediminis]|uniref:S1 family peptidase n=1 Tax=Roseibium sediminis TaxID=1775174 RepID=UPI00123CC558|nr:serine protease [Roseibium sediminis]